MRLGPNIDLGYDDEARTENVKRLAMIALLLSRARPSWAGAGGCTDPFVIVSAVTPRILHRLVAQGICDPLLAYVTGADKKLWLGTHFDEPDVALEPVGVHIDTKFPTPDLCAAMIVQKLEEEGLLE